MTPNRAFFQSATTAAAVFGLTAAIAAMSVIASTPTYAMQRQLNANGDSCVHHVTADGRIIMGTEKDGECCVGDDCIIILKPFPKSAMLRSKFN